MTRDLYAACVRVARTNPDITGVMPVWVAFNRAITMHGAAAIGGAASTGQNIEVGYALTGSSRLPFSAGRNLTNVADIRPVFTLAL